MHRYNNKYGYGRILRRFCGVSQNTPIWGEIQHALFLNTHYFTADGRLGPPREQRQRFPRLLSWQNLLPFPHQIPIGDPLLYANVSVEGESVSSGDVSVSGDYTVLMPKLNDEVPRDERARHYLGAAKEARELSGNDRLLVALHPREKVHRSFFEQHLGPMGEVVWADDEYPGGPTAWSQKLLAQSTRLFSDYFGAHVFRASWFFDLPVSIIGPAPINSATHSTMLEHLTAFLDAQGQLEGQKMVSQTVLGVQFVRSAEELTDILGFSGWRRMAGRPVRVVYQRLRRLRVAVRRRGMQ